MSALCDKPPRVTQGCSTPATTKKRLLVVLVSMIVGAIVWYVLMNFNMSRRNRMITIGLVIAYVAFLTWDSASNGLLSGMIKSCRWETRYDAVVETLLAKNDKSVSAEMIASQARDIVNGEMDAEIRQITANKMKKMQAKAQAKADRIRDKKLQQITKSGIVAPANRAAAF